MLIISILSLTSISQLALFLGIGLILFGWIEKKEKLVLAGQITLLLLGLFAGWILFANIIQVPIGEGSVVLKEAKMLGFCKIAIVLLAADIVSIVMTRLKIRFHLVSTTIVLLLAMMLFFMVFNIQQMPG